MNPLLFNYIIAHALAGILPLCIGLFVFIKNPTKPLFRRFFIYNITISWWGFFTVLMQFSPTPQVALLIDRIELLAIAFIPTTFLHFTLEYLQETKKYKKLIGLTYFLSSIFFILSCTPLMAKSVSKKGFITYFTDPGSIYIFFVIMFSIISTAAVIAIHSNYSKQKDELKKQGLLYFLIVTILAAIGGGANFLVPFNILIPILIPFGTYAVVLYGIVTAYVILRYQLLDIEVIIKKTLVFAGMFAFSFGVIVAVALITQELLPQYLAISRRVSLAISIIIIIFALRPIESFLVNTTNRYLFQKHYDPRKILKDFGDEVLTILNLDRICQITIDTLVKNLYLTNCSVLLLSQDETTYDVYNAYGIKSKNISYETDSPLIKHLRVTHLPILHQSPDKFLQASDEIKKEMDKMQSRFCMPLTIHSEVVGILSLGAKKSDQAYTEDDIDILTTLSKALSIAISNARLFTQAAQYEKLAAIGILASGINHEVCNPLNNISVRMQIFAENIKRGMFKDKSKEDVMQHALEVIQKSIGEIHRVAAITGKLSSFAKPSKEVFAKPVAIAQSVADALGVVGHKLQLDKVKIQQDIPEDLPEIMADEDQMQQIFFNLIRNGAESIEEEGVVSISAREEKNVIKVDVSDTGCGIPEDKLNKVFEPFYSTKAREGKGSGFGLAIVRELIWRNKGNVAIESQVGKGTTFHLEFPKAVKKWQR